MKKIEKNGMKSITGGKTVCQWIEERRVTICKVFYYQFGGVGISGIAYLIYTVDIGVYDEKGRRID